LRYLTHSILQPEKPCRALRYSYRVRPFRVQNIHRSRKETRLLILRQQLDELVAMRSHWIVRWRIAPGRSQLAGHWRSAGRRLAAGKPLREYPKLQARRGESEVFSKKPAQL
jgi:hypothetical protein